MRFCLPVLLLVPLVVGAQPPRVRAAPKNAPARLRQMDPKQRQRMLESLPPDRRKQAAERLDRLESLPPEERRQLERRWEHFSRLSPEDRDKARELFRDFSALPEDRKAALSGAFDQLRNLSAPQRLAWLDDKRNRRTFSRQELQLLRRYCEIAGEP